MYPTCVACLEETPVVVIFNCDSNTSHCVCCECARRMVSDALTSRNFSGDAMCLTLEFELSCPMCRRKVYTNPFKKLPTEIYKLYDATQDTSEPPLTCVRCAAQHRKCETHVDHVLYNCPKDVFSCKLCRCDVKWNVMDTEQLLRHVHDDECTGVCCGCAIRGGQCGFTGTFSSANAHHESHHVRNVLIRRFTEFIRDSIDIAHLPNMLGIDLYTLAHQLPPEALVAEYNAIAAADDESNVADDDSDSDGDEPDDASDSDTDAVQHSHAPSGSI